MDLCQIHRWDYEAPIEETLDALNDVVRSGKVRYIGASSMHAWQFAKSVYLSRINAAGALFCFNAESLLTIFSIAKKSAK